MKKIFWKWIQKDIIYERQLVGYEDEMDYHAIGTISELFDGNPPFHGRGAMSFAMNVAEILRTLKLMDKYSYQK